MSVGEKRTPLTPEASPHVVLRLARRLAARFDPWGALEFGDYVGAACVGFYEARARWTGAGDFQRFAFGWMLGTIREHRRREARQHVGYVPQPHQGVRRPPTPAQRDQRRQYARDYRRSHGLKPCVDCGGPVERGHGAQRCLSCAPAWRRHRDTTNKRQKRDALQVAA